MSSLSLPFSYTREHSNSLARYFDADALDWNLLALWLCLLSLGLVMIASASITFADHTYGDTWFFVKRHLVYLVLGLTAAACVAIVPARLWQRYSSLILLCSIILLALVLVPGIGRRVNGAQRWLALGPITVQASEIAKFAALIFFASFFSRRQQELQSGWWGFSKPVGVVTVLALLLLLEPDFGSTVVLTVMVFSMLFLAGARLWQFSLLVVAGAAGLALMAVFSPYRMKRLAAYLDPWADQFDTGYQLTQSLIAFGRGEVFGAGLGNSVQKLFYLPEAHTDFIFAIFAEEFGLIGVALVIALFSVMVWRILCISRRAIVQEKPFESFVCFGAAILIAFQVFVNIGVTSGLLPTKGLTLPFISYGGSSLVISCVLMALLLRIDWELRNDLGEAPSTDLQKNKNGGEL